METNSSTTTPTFTSFGDVVFAYESEKSLANYAKAAYKQEKQINQQLVTYIGQLEKQNEFLREPTPGNGNGDAKVFFGVTGGLVVGFLIGWVLSAKL